MYTIDHVDYEEAFDIQNSFRNTKNLETNPIISHFLEISMLNWQTSINLKTRKQSNNQSYQNPFSALWFCLAMNPLLTSLDETG
jgi:hypothetical protein